MLCFELKRGRCASKLTKVRREVVTSYINPDTDGVCSAVAYAHLNNSIRRVHCVPVFFGMLAQETLFVLDHFKISRPKLVSKIPSSVAIIIVDTHNISQIPKYLPLRRVVEILDHHFEGNLKDFPNAKTEVEKVGAVATLVAERMICNNFEPQKGIAGILVAAIISNTLNFLAPSTDVRDKRATDWLLKHVTLEKDFVEKMFEARSDIADKTTEEILKSDYKEFIIEKKKIGISQFETTNLAMLFNRRDIRRCINKIKLEKQLSFFIFNGVDILHQNSIIAAGDPESKKLVQLLFDSEFEDCKMEIPRILLRKTDFIPKLMSHFQIDKNKV